MTVKQLSTKIISHVSVIINFFFEKMLSFHLHYNVHVAS